MILVELKTERMQKLMDALQLVAELKGEAIDTVIAREGAYLATLLYQGFSRHQWGGKPRQKDIAERELAARTAAHIGTHIRPEVLEKMGWLGKISRIREQRASLRARGKDVEKNQQRAVSLWQKIVGKEIAKRQAGIGVLGVGFLWRRGMINKAGDTVYVRNRTGATAGRMEMGPGWMRITNYVPGALEQEARHGIINEAIDHLLRVERSYATSKIRKNFEEAFSSMMQAA